MKVLVIPDVHQTNIGLDIAKKYIGSVDKVCFLGDYVDSFDANVLRGTDNDGAHTLERIFDFKKSFPDKVTLLCGNHDFSYLARSMDGQMVSGHQPDHEAIEDVLLKNLSLLEAAIEIDGIVYSHAGISKQWYKENNSPTIGKMNEWLQNREEEHFNWYGLYDGAGDEPMQTPFWIRPFALCRGSKYPTGETFFNMQYKKQIVGHTEVCKNRVPTIINNTVNYFSCMPKDSFLMIVDSTSRDCTVIIDNGKLTDWKPEI